MTTVNVMNDGFSVSDMPTLTGHCKVLVHLKCLITVDF